MSQAKAKKFTKHSTNQAFGEYTRLGTSDWIDYSNVVNGKRQAASEPSFETPRKICNEMVSIQVPHALLSDKKGFNFTFL